MGTDLAQFARHGAIVTDVDLSAGPPAARAGELPAARADRPLRPPRRRDAAVRRQHVRPRLQQRRDPPHAEHGAGRRRDPSRAEAGRPGDRDDVRGELAAVLAQAGLALRARRAAICSSQSMGEIMSRTVERTGNDARPLVKVYTQAAAARAVRAPSTTSGSCSVRFRRSSCRAGCGGCCRSSSGSPGWNLIIKARKPRALMRATGRPTRRAAAPPARAPAAPAAEPPPRRWADELADAGVSPATSGSPDGRRPAAPVRRSAGRRASSICAARIRRCVRATIAAADARPPPRVQSARQRPVSRRSIRTRRRRAAAISRSTGTSIRLRACVFRAAFRIAQWNLEQMRPGRADIKLPWELAPLPALAAARPGLPADRRRSIRRRDRPRAATTSWKPIPIGIGVNWTCTMDVALRAANWALALELIRSCASLTPASGATRTRRCSITASSSKAISRTTTR